MIFPFSSKSANQFFDLVKNVIADL